MPRLCQTHSLCLYTHLRFSCQKHMREMCTSEKKSKFLIALLLRHGRCFLQNSRHTSFLHPNSNTKHRSKKMANDKIQIHYDWHPREIVNIGKQTPYACVVLNRKITVSPDVTVDLWQNAVYRCTVDGGTNRWRDFISSLSKGNELKLPDFITGDFDSITKETREYFSEASIKYVHTPDQDFTDFHKAIKVLAPYLKEKNISEVYVLHDTSGRIDHILGNLQVLHTSPPELNIYILCGTSITWLLRPGDHTINIPQDLVDNKRWCAVLPVGGRAIVTTTGLKWDLNKGVLEFGAGIVSSSNTYNNDTVHIETDKAVIWSMGVFNFHDD